MSEQNKSTKLNADLQECIGKLSQKKVDELFLNLEDLHQIEKAVTTLVMHLFGDLEQAECKRVEIEHDDATDIRNGLVSIRKIQRLFDIVNPGSYDICDIAVKFDQLKA